MRSHKLADFTDGKPCPTSHRESVATLGPEPTSATSLPELLPGHTGWASGGTGHMGWASGQGRQAQLLAQFVWGLSPPPKYKLCDSTDHTYFAMLDFQCLVS